MGNKKKILFIINPVSGTGRQRLVEKALSQRLDLSRFDYEIAYSRERNHGIVLAAEASAKGFEVVVAVGGDGSANEVAQGIVNTPVIMGIIPVGSGNGLAHHLKIPPRINAAIDIINKMNVTRIDTATFNEKLFISIAGVGFDALVAEKFTSNKNRGFFSYLKIVMKEFSRYKPSDYKISFDGKEIRREALLICFANSGQFGYNANISPTASVHDGLIDLCIVKNIGFIRAALVARKLFIKEIGSSNAVEVFKVKEAEIQCNAANASQIDGDFIGNIQSAFVKIQPHSLNIIVP